VAVGQFEHAVVALELVPRHRRQQRRDVHGDRDGLVLARRQRQHDVLDDRVRPLIFDLEVPPLPAGAHFALDREMLVTTARAELDARVQPRRCVERDVRRILAARSHAVVPAQVERGARGARVTGRRRVADDAEGAGLEADLVDEEIRGQWTRDLGAAAPGDGQARGADRRVDPTRGIDFLVVRRAHRTAGEQDGEPRGKSVRHVTSLCNQSTIAPMLQTAVFVDRLSFASVQLVQPAYTRRTP
jgi:hypothetical protein